MRTKVAGRGMVEVWIVSGRKISKDLQYKVALVIRLRAILTITREPGQYTRSGLVVGYGD